MTGCVSFFRGYFDCFCFFTIFFKWTVVCYQEWSFPSLTRVTTLGFSVFLVRFFGFCTEKLRFLGFVGRCGFRFFGFLAPGFLAKIKQVRFLSESPRSPDVRLNPGQIAMWDFGFFIEVYSRQCQALGQCRWAEKANEKRKKHGSSENVSERKTAGREKGVACKHLFRPLPRPPIVKMSKFARAH